MRTQFDEKNKSFTDKCHMIAQEKFYPVVFNTTQDKIESVDTSLSKGEKEQILDGQMAVDRILHVTVFDLMQPLEFTIQERFRRPEYLKWQDVTITEWNRNSNLPSELYKLNAGMFVYGYANDAYKPTDLLQAYAVNTTKVLHLIATGGIKYNRQINPKNQYFIGIRIDELRKTGCMIAEYYYNSTAEQITQEEFEFVF